MNISSRTPEGTPNECPVCQKNLCIEPSSAFGDAPCPHCGTLLWFVKSPSGIRVFDQKDIPLRKQALIGVLASLWSRDSLDRVEFLMKLEELGIEIEEEELARIETLDEFIDFLIYHLPD